MHVSSSQPSQPSSSSTTIVFSCHIDILSNIYAAFNQSQLHRKYHRRAMDPLSIAAAVAGFLSLAGQIAATLKDYVDGVLSALKDFQSLHLEVTALHHVLEEFVTFLRNDALDGRKFESTSALFAAVKGCQNQLQRHRERRLKVASSHVNGGMTSARSACSSNRTFYVAYENQWRPITLNPDSIFGNSDTW
ncbi:hypothetical protein BZA77DRAFT_297661 [Pyronema omphalodes]|nr:hypothetical protein BZA77DRAFT_297661 [Pyronema omphalodes]